MTTNPAHDRVRSAFKPSRPGSAFPRVAPDMRWYWEGLIPQAASVMLSAHPKAGKTTLLCDLLRAAGTEASSCGRPLSLSRILVVSEESEYLWGQRDERRPFPEGVRIMARQMPFKPTQKEWEVFLELVNADAQSFNAQVIVFDTISKLWPVANENDAAQVQEALAPLNVLLKDKQSIVLIHHLKKTDGAEGTGARGSSAIAATVDVIIEMRRVFPSDSEHPRRRLKFSGRDMPNGTHDITYDVAAGRYHEAEVFNGHPDHDPLEHIGVVLQNADRPLSGDDIYPALPAGRRGSRSVFLSRLRQGVNSGRWFTSGSGRRGDPFRYSLTRQNPTPENTGAEPTGAEMLDMTPDQYRAFLEKAIPAFRPGGRTSPNGP